MEPYDWTIKAGATAPPLRWGIENENNSAVDISGQKGISIFIRDVNSTTLLVNGAAMTTTDSTGGLVDFYPTTGSTSGYDGTNVFVEIHVTLADNTLMKVPEDGYSLGRVISALG